MVIGDNRRFLSALLTMKVNMNPKDNTPTNILSNECKMHMKNLNIPNFENINTVEDALKSPDIKKYIDQCFAEANKRAISRAQHIRKWFFVERDFSVPNGEFTSTMKMRRKIIEKMYTDKIENVYADPKL